MAVTCNKKVADFVSWSLKCIIKFIDWSLRKIKNFGSYYKKIIEFKVLIMTWKSWLLSVNCSRKLILSVSHWSILQNILRILSFCHLNFFLIGSFINLLQKRKTWILLMHFRKMSIGHKEKRNRFWLLEKKVMKFVKYLICSKIL